LLNLRIYFNVNVITLLLK